MGAVPDIHRLAFRMWELNRWLSTQDGLRTLLGIYESRGIPRVFAWLSPGPDDALVREWLHALSFKRVPWTRYPTMLFTTGAGKPCDHPFEIREVEAAEFAIARNGLDGAVMEGFERTLGAWKRNAPERVRRD